MDYPLTINGKTYDLESPGHICLGFCIFDVSYPAYDKPPHGLSVPYGEIRARTPRQKVELQKDLDRIEPYVDQVRQGLPDDETPLDKLTEEQWADCRRKLVDIIELVDEIPGIGLSLATKILHRHLPHLIPIVDELCIREKHGYKGELGIVLDSIRRDMILSQSSIDEALSFVAERLGGACLTRVRVFDIFLWAIMNADNKKVKVVYTRLG